MALVTLIASGSCAPAGQEAAAQRTAAEPACQGGESGQHAMPGSMRMPTEITQHIYLLLAPADFNAARQSCRSWFVASLNRVLLVEMLRKGGWWSSMLRILAPLDVARTPSINQERIMSKWISRECSLSDSRERAFTMVGRTDFGDMMQMSGTGGLALTASLCGRYVTATYGQTAHVYELNHVCPQARAPWSIPPSRREGLPPGLLRPVTTVVCPRRILSCSMDTSAGRHAIAFLMDGRVGMVCDMVGEAQRWCGTPGPRISTSASTSSSAPALDPGSTSPRRTSTTPRECVCLGRPPLGPPPVESGPRSVYRNICHSDDPPRSVAICPQRNCVAFGCGAGIELHWVDALAGQDVSRWFPLSSASDFLYFLPARRGLDTAKRLRLISSAAAFTNPFDSIGHVLDDFGAHLVGSSSTAVLSLAATMPGLLGSRTSPPPPELAARRRPGRLPGAEERHWGFRTVSAGSADHYRAVPLSDGCHILFTDPRTGRLCLGTDAPVGSLTRLLRKMWFRPPSAAASPAPVLYAAGADSRHGVRVVASFAATNAPDGQVVVFYSVPPDLFHDMTPGGAADEAAAAWRPDEGYRAVDIFSEPFQSSTAHPIEIGGQVIATCGRLSELALDSGPEMIIWAFGASGWATTWALDTGASDACVRAAVQRDGSVRCIDDEGDVAMGEAGDDEADGADAGLVHLQRYDGAAGSTPIEADSPPLSYFLPRRPREMGGTVSVDVVEVHGIVRLDVQLQ